MARLTREIEVWGTVLYVDVASPDVDESALKTGLDRVRDFSLHVDEVFSTYKSESVVSKLRREEISIESTSDEVKEVWNLCIAARDMSGGAFNPWAVAGGFDPSGLVKGWAADKCAEILQAHGGRHILVNAAGDLALRGGTFVDGAVQPWSIGIVNPDNRQETVRHFQISDGAIATSGTYEKGAHILDPHSGMIAIGAKSATVIGPNGALTDALATALMVEGRDGAAIFGNPELSEYSVWVIDRYGDVAWSLGPLS
ncbi:MAG: hypothetical protein F2677_04445 [Actinobacteria bacterium]|uniref:FAD:protein FMN transferase n=1 Tax=freshwater metagenome TaxID=449393 RepID=A0A6J6QFP8_9ZZZZ|nr:hypothetical protein [Actinomycetota bacterium]MSZ69109.1 hypothetical protein [Actinomycetota bacterium]